jgi:hypothetical protein
VRRISLLGLLLLVAAIPSLTAQSASRPAVGARVRLMTPALAEHPQVIGRIIAVDSTAVTVHTDFGEDTRLPRQFIAQVAISDGATRGKVSVVRAAFAGLLLGALAGRLSIPERPDNARQTGFRYAVKGGMLGGFAGAIFGAVNRPERWVRVVLSGGTLSPPSR